MIIYKMIYIPGDDSHLLELERAALLCILVILCSQLPALPNHNHIFAAVRHIPPLRCFSFEASRPWMPRCCCGGICPLLKLSDHKTITDRQAPRHEGLPGNAQGNDHAQGRDNIEREVFCKQNEGARVKTPPDSMIRNTHSSLGKGVCIHELRVTFTQYHR